MGNTVGTLEWAEQTRGILRFQDRLRLVGQFARELPHIPWEILPRLGRVPRLRSNQAPAPPPATPIAREAAELCMAACSNLSWLYAHSCRTFRFAQLFAQYARVEFDPEILWVAAMLHDVGFTDESFAAAPDVPCFAVRGAARARNLAEQHDWPPACRQRLSEAIALHVNVRVPKRQSMEGHLLNLGSALDVGGTRYGQIYSPSMKEIVDEEFPRGDFQLSIQRMWNKEADRASGCRAPFLNSIGFGCLMKTTPFRHTDTRPTPTR